jgi:CDP-glycerol glycerophosphotransferase (TagB/SpsB family)
MTYEFLLVLIALKKIVNDDTVLIYMNLLDRWQILFDRLPNNCTRILVEHGELFSNIAHIRFHHIKINNVNEVYYFDKKTKNVTIKYLLNDPALIKFSPIKHHLDLLEIKKNNSNKSVLLIAAIQNYERQDILIQYLLDNNYNVIIKPHPILGTHYANNFYGNIFEIKDRSFFPAVDLVISVDNSSLAIEYEFMEIPVIWLNSYNQLTEALRNIRLTLEIG